MQFFKCFFGVIKSTFKFIHNYFKSFLFLLLIILIAPAFLSNETTKRPNLATINIHGAIMDVQNKLEEIEKISKDDNIKGVLLHVDSPGGALAPSVELAYAIKQLREKKPVVAYAAGTMASGSYYASINANKIYANPGAFIGSIGVVFQGFNIEELIDKIGIKPQVVKAGDFKETGVFYRQWSQDEKAALEKLIFDSYELFVGDVAKARGLDIKNKNSFANANVFLPSEAKKQGLIDEVGTLQNAKDAIVKLSEVKEAVWMKPDKIDQMMEKILQESAKIFIQSFYGLKAQI